MNSMLAKIRIASALLLCPLYSIAQNQIILDNGSCSLSIEEDGGAFSSFTLNGNSINPFSWALNPEQMPANNRKGAPFRGHFLCLGRWGDPTSGEIEAGMPNNGDISTKKWQTDTEGKTKVRLRSLSGLDFMALERTVEMDPDIALFSVIDKVKNEATIGRLFNIVQHATLGSPFFNTSTVINSNAGQGFMQDKWMPAPESNEYTWPYGKLAKTGECVDLQRSDGKESYVSTHIFTDTIGWVTAYSPEHNLLLGYVWKTSDYPWLNLWHQTLDDQPWAKGLEFGTTGVGAPYDILLSENTDFHGNKSYFFFDALEETERVFICFLIPVDHEFEGVENIVVNPDEMEIINKNKKSIKLNSHLISKL